ncbi:hypothetical protein SPI_03332 [Niveomyces insectorum RCEF 264]|uniref:Uncharacterized protein n=1 Tax=Niveomyces insectorum RCEF 264 TaxID=1081102 RepID=A0A167X9A0_9HYPO|nr:hypothetical protein SPI_03332 [Niveomyces insectorum RCEF 264]
MSSSIAIPTASSSADAHDGNPHHPQHHRRHHRHHLRSMNTAAGPSAVSSSSMMPSPSSASTASSASSASSSANTPSRLLPNKQALSQSAPSEPTMRQQQKMGHNRRPSLLSSAISQQEAHVINIGEPDGPPRLISYLTSSQGFTWNPGVASFGAASGDGPYSQRTLFKTTNPPSDKTMDGSHHRKIELQSPEDFAYLVANVRRAAAASVAAAFPPVDDDGDRPDGPDNHGRTKSKKKKKPIDEDDLHARVEGLVNEYIRRTFALAAPNLTINGLPVDPDPYWTADGDHGDSEDEHSSGTHKPLEVVEPFDTRKRQRVEDLARDEEDLLRDIARLKRRVPPAAVAAHALRLTAALEADDAAAAAVERAVQATNENENDDGGAASEQNNIDPAVPATFARAVAGLGRLKQTMPATVARMDRARVAGAYAVSKR